MCEAFASITYEFRIQALIPFILNQRCFNFSHASQDPCTIIFLIFLKFFLFLFFSIKKSKFCEMLWTINFLVVYTSYQTELFTIVYSGLILSAV